MKRSFITIMCLLIALVTLLTACGGNGGNNVPTGSTPADGNNPGDPSGGNTGGNTPQISLQESVPAKNIDRDIRILTDYVPDDDIHEPNGDPMWDVQVDMYLYAEEKFNVTLEFKAPSTGWVYSTMEQLQGSDQNEFDLIYSPHPTVGMYNLLTSGTLANLQTVDTVNLQKECYNQSQVQNHTANGRLYMAVPDFTIIGQALPSIIYNVESYARYGFTEDLYETVKSGKWTMDKLLEMVTTASSTNLGGSEGTKTYGMAYWHGMTYTMMYAMGENILVKNVDGKFERGLNAERLDTIAQKLAALVNDSDMTVISITNNAAFGESDMWKAFSSGRALFFTMDVGSMSHWLRDLEFDVHYLPVPKLYENDDYRAVCASGFCGIPNIAYSVSDSGLIFESMAAYGNEHVKPALFENVLLGRLSKEQADYEALNYLHSIKFFEFGYTFDETNAGRNIMATIVFDGGGLGGSKAVTAYIRAHGKDLQKIVDQANALGDDTAA